MKLHPDRGGDPAKFQEIQAASEILCDPKKRAYYDKHGEEGAAEHRGERRKKGPGSKSKITATLEQLYTGNQRKLQVGRKVIDKDSMSTCARCHGQGATVKVIRMGPMVQQVQATCDACGGQGSSFRSKSQTEVLEVHVPKGAPNGHKIVFNEKANEIPDGDAGDVVLTISEMPHPVFKRKGDDLYLTRAISLSDALCGFSMEVTHLDGRKLVVKTSAGDVIRPISYDPFGESAEPEASWETLENTDCPGVEDAAEGRTDDPDTCKKVVSKGQLKDKGIGAFVIRGGKTTFKQCTRSEALAGKRTARGATMYVLGDPESSAGGRMMKAVVGEGMPRLSNPFEKGNLFVVFNIEFPTAPLAPAAQAALLAAIPKKHSVSAAAEGDASVEVATLSEVDPYASYHDHLPPPADADSDDEGQGGGPGGVGCQQS